MDEMTFGHSLGKLKTTDEIWWELHSVMFGI